MKSYFLTYGRGLESIVLDELKSLLKSGESSEIVFESDRKIEGKLAFRTDLPISRLIGLKTIERLFVSILFRQFAAGHDDKPIDNNKELLTYINEKFSFDFKDYVPFKHVEPNENESSSAKRVCRSFKFRVDCRMTG